MPPSDEVEAINSQTTDPHSPAPKFLLELDLPRFAVEVGSDQRNGPSELAATRTHSSAVLGLDTLDDEDFGTEQHVYCLPIVTNPRGPTRFFGPNGGDQLLIFDRAYSLILVRNPAGTYRRIGYVDFRSTISWQTACPEMEITIV